MAAAAAVPASGTESATQRLHERLGIFAIGMLLAIAFALWDLGERYKLKRTRDAARGRREDETLRACNSTNNVSLLFVELHFYAKSHFYAAYNVY